MPVTDMTNEYMRKLPAALRPNPWNLDDTIILLAGKGWNVADMFAATMAQKPMQPGHIVATMRNLLEQPAPNSGKGWAYGHTPCENPTHQKCEICRCIPGKVVHQVNVPASEQTKMIIRRGMAGMEIPE